MVRQNLINFAAFSDELQKIAWALPTAAIVGAGSGLVGGGLGAVAAEPGERLKGFGRGALVGGGLGAAAGALGGHRVTQHLRSQKLPSTFSELMGAMKANPGFEQEIGQAVQRGLGGVPNAGIAEQALGIAAPVGGIAGGLSTRFGKRRRREED